MRYVHEYAENKNVFTEGVSDDGQTSQPYPLFLISHL